MKRRLTAFLILVSCCGCGGASQLPMPSTNQPVAPLGIQQDPTHEDYSIQYNPDVTKAGVTRAEVETFLGPPDATQALPDGQVEAIYAFFLDGGKFVNTDPAIQLSASFFSHRGVAATVPSQLDGIKSELTFYHIHYRPDGTVLMVTVDKPKAEAIPPVF